MKRIITIAALVLASCSAFTVHVKPLSPGAKHCASDYDCTDNQHCGFPGVDTYPQCLPGSGEQYSYPDTDVPSGR